jgi:chromate transporter
MSGRKPLGELVRLFLRLGFAGFGGPLVHIAMMETEVVERRRWLTKQEFLDALALCQMLPGPASTQLGVLICHTRGGLRGALLGGAAFILPGFCVMLAFTLLYEHWGALPALGPLFAGIAPAVVAVILFSAWPLGRSAVTRLVAATIPLARGAVVSPFTAAVWLASVGILWRLRVDTVWLVLGAGAAGWLWSLAA